jgi:hypothetical protein
MTNTNDRADGSAGGGEGDFQNFHRLLCERFGYVHDEKDWKRDQLSLIEHIAGCAEGGKSESFEEAAKICEKWAASIDTGKKRNRVVAAAMQGALTCANEIRAAIEEQK